jgi:predicted nucleotidyltransferase
MQLAQDRFKKIEFYEDLVCAFIGGSVARGFADDFSDLEIF